MRNTDVHDSLSKLIKQIDFESERYYNLCFESSIGQSEAKASDEVWTNLSALTADLGKMRTELARMRRGVEDLRMPAIEAVGLDRLAEQLRSLETRIRPLTNQGGADQDESKIRRFLKDLLLVLDTMDRVRELGEERPESITESVRMGLDATYTLLSDLVKRNGLMGMDIKRGDKFNPNHQLAVGTEPNPKFEDGSISQVLQKGYLLNDQVFRTAQVVVVKN